MFNKCPKCNSEQLVPKYVKRSQLDTFKRGEAVDFCTRTQRDVLRLIICDDCKGIVFIPGETPIPK